MFLGPGAPSGDGSEPGGSAPERSGRAGYLRGGRSLPLPLRERGCPLSFGFLRIQARFPVLDRQLNARLSSGKPLAQSLVAVPTLAGAPCASPWRASPAPPPDRLVTHPPAGEKLIDKTDR